MFILSMLNCSLAAILPNISVLVQTNDHKKKCLCLLSILKYKLPNLIA